MENQNKRANDSANTQNNWQDAAHEGDWQLAESNAEDTAAMLTTYQADAENPKLYAAGDEEDRQDDETETEESDDEQAKDWGHTDPLDGPLPNSNDPSGPGSAV